MYTERKMHSGLIGSLCIVAVVLLLAFHTRPAQKTSNELATQRQALAQELALVQGEEDIGAITGISEVERKEIDQAIPAAIEQDTIITDLARIAKTADVTFNGLTFSLEDRTNLHAVNISAGFQGPGANIIRFLKFVESNPRMFVVRDASVSHVETQGGLDLVTLQLTIQAFYRNDSI